MGIYVRQLLIWCRIKVALVLILFLCCFGVVFVLVCATAVDVAHFFSEAPRLGSSLLRVQKKKKKLEGTGMKVLYPM